ncbi:hypothetical protein LY76DRAFT_528666, partial [Colletotrichum caudatum]
DAIACRVLYAEADISHITPSKPYNFTLQENGNDGVPWLACCIAADEPFNNREEHLEALSNIPETGRV